VPARPAVRPDSGAVHAVCLDGVYSADRDGKGLMFHPAPAPSQDEIESLVGRASKRILRFLQRCKIITLVTAPGHGEVTVVGDETMDEKDPLLANLLAAATAGAAPAGRANQRQPLRVVLDPDDRPVGKGTLCPQTQGFNLHAATKVAANNKPGRPTPCRYVLRPPLASRVGSRPALLEPIVVERWSAISASAAASCPKCSIFRAELQRADRAQRGRETAEVHDRFHLPQQVGSHQLAGHDALFPAGTWWLCRFAGLKCEELGATAPPS
jgi:hypothetical protein